MSATGAPHQPSATGATNAGANAADALAAAMAAADRLAVFATNIGNMIADVSFNVIDEYLLCGGGGGSNGSSDTSSAAAATLAKRVVTVRTFEDVWARCTSVHGERRMNIVYYVAVLVAALVVLQTLWGLLRVFRSPAGLPRGGGGKGAQQKKSSSDAAQKRGKKSNVADGEEAVDASSPDESSSPAASVGSAESSSKAEAAILDSDTFRFSKAIVAAAVAASNAITPTPASQIFANSSASGSAAGSPIKPSNKTAFPSRVGAMLASPCQQYWLITCRATMEARVYPQNHKAQFLTKGADLSRKLYLSLGYAIGPVLGVTTTSPGTNSPAVDISVASFLASTPLSTLQYNDEGAGGNASSSASSSSFDPLLVDSSSCYLAVGESQKDTYVILRLTTSSTPLGASADAAASDGASLSGDAGARHAAAKALLSHYKTTPVRAEVLWLYRRPNHRLVWDTYRFGLFSSFSCAPTAKMSFASCGVGHGSAPLFGAGAGAEHMLAVPLAEHQYYTSSSSAASPADTAANIADILVFANAEDTSVEMIHRSHVGDGREVTPWGAYRSEKGAAKEKEKTSGKDRDKGKGKAGANNKASAEQQSTNGNPTAALIAEADADWHPQRLRPGQPAPPPRTKNTNKFSVGAPSAMLLADPIVLCCGTFTTEPTVSQLTLPRYPLTSGAAGPSSVKELLGTYAIDRFFPAEAMRPRGVQSSHVSSLASAAHSVAPQRLRVPRIVPAYLTELSALVRSALTSSSVDSFAPSSSAVSNAELLSRFIHQSSSPSSSSNGVGQEASFTRSGFAVQQVALLNPFQPASTLSYGAGAGGHRPSFCVVFCDNGCGFVYDVATYWEAGSSSPGGGGGASGSSGGSGGANSHEILRSYATFSGEEKKGSLSSSSVEPHRRSADRPIATFYDIAFARKEAKLPSSSSSPSSSVIGGCDLMTVCVAGSGPRYSLRIAIANKARRAISVFDTSVGVSNAAAPSPSSFTEKRSISFIDAPLTNAVLSTVAPPSQSSTAAAVTASESAISTAATAAANLPPNTTTTPFTDVFASTGRPLAAVAKWSAVHPTYNKYGEANTIEHMCFLQNGLGIATVGKDDGLGILMHAL